MITVLNSLNLMESEGYLDFLERLKSKEGIDIDRTVYIKVLQNDLIEINKLDINIMDIKDKLSEEKFFQFCVGRIKLDIEIYNKHIQKEMEKIQEIEEYPHLKEIFNRIYRKHFLLVWMVDYYFLSIGIEEFFNSLDKREIPLYENYKREIMKLHEEIV